MLKYTLTFLFAALLGSAAFAQAPVQAHIDGNDLVLSFDDARVQTYSFQQIDPVMAEAVRTTTGEVADLGASHQARFAMEPGGVYLLKYLVKGDEEMEDRWIEVDPLSLAKDDHR
jgi:hypothetical protein